MDFGDFLHTSFHAFESAQPIYRHARHHADMARCGQGRQGVGHVMLAGHIPIDGTLQRAVKQHLKARAVITEQPGLPLTIDARGLYRRPAAHFDYTLQCRLGGRVDNQPFTRDSAHQMVELPLNGRQVREDVSVIELEIVEDCRARTVVDKLRALVEKGAVIFIGFYHKERRITQTGRHGKVLRHAADQETRGHARVLQHPGQHAAGRGFTVGTCHGQYPAALQHMVSQPLRAGHVRQALVEHVLNCGVATGQRIADHHYIWRRIELNRVIALG